jgi:Protein of unknown function (DUF3306)
VNEDENFLSRWSRRKQEIARQEAKLEQKPTPEPEADTTPAPNATSDGPAVDLSKLPPLDEITGETDISGFLQQGVPTDLARAALRRAWASDPAIRDFVGLQENDWVFNKPGPEQGFGPLGPDTDVGKLLAQVFGEAPKDAAVEDQGQMADSKHVEMPADAAATPNEGTIQPADPPNDALHKEAAKTSPSRHSHGGALPRPISES